VCKLSLRIPPNLEPEGAKNNLVKLLTDNPPYNASIIIDPKSVSAGSGLYYNIFRYFLMIKKNFVSCLNNME